MGHFLWLYSQRKGAWNWPRNLHNKAKRNVKEATIYMSCLNVVNYWLKLVTWLQSLLQGNVFDEKRQAGGELPQLLLLLTQGLQVAGQPLDQLVHSQAQLFLAPSLGVLQGSFHGYRLHHDRLDVLHPGPRLLHHMVELSDHLFHSGFQHLVTL